MATVLALETSANACSAALLYRDEVFERHELMPRSHTQHILPMVDSLLARAGIALPAVDVIAFGRGPGSFTGLRVCASVVQGLAYAAGIPCAPVSSLQALAKTALEAGLCDGKDEILCCIDARMNELYCAQYSLRDGVLMATAPEFLAAPEAVAWDHGTACRVGSGWHYSQAMGYNGLIDDADMLPRASAVAQLGKHMFSEGQCVAPEQALPVYLRDDVAWR